MSFTRFAVQGTVFGFPNQDLAKLQAGTTRAVRRRNCLKSQKSCKKELQKLQFSIINQGSVLIFSLAVASATAIRNRTNIVLGKPFLSMHGMCSMVATHTETEPVSEPGLVSGPYVAIIGLL